MPVVPRGYLLAGLVLALCLWLLREALAPFFLSVVMAYLLLPFVDRLAVRFGREWATVLVLLGAIALLAGITWLMLPLLIDQAYRLVENFPALKQSLLNRLQPLLQMHPMITLKARALLEGISMEPLLSGLKYAGAGILGLFLRLMTLLLVPVILYYLLVDGPAFLGRMGRLVPPRYRRRVFLFVLAVHKRLGGYIRGQLAVATVMGLLQGVTFVLMGVPYGWLLGLVAGISNVVPYSPYITALPAALILAGSQGFGRSHILLIALMFALVQKAETLYFTPVWVGRASRLHPLAVLLSVLVFGFAFGLTGLIFAVPLMIVIKVASEYILVDYQKQAWFRSSRHEGQ